MHIGPRDPSPPTPERFWVEIAVKDNVSIPAFSLNPESQGPKQKYLGARFCHSEVMRLPHGKFSGLGNSLFCTPSKGSCLPLPAWNGT